MGSKDKLKEVDIENHRCYCFDDIIRFWDRDIDELYIKKNTKIF